MNRIGSVPLPKTDLKKIIAGALAEDLGDGDHTSLSTIPAGKRGTMRLLAKDSGVIAGVEAARLVFRAVDPSIRVRVNIKDGEQIKPGDVVLEISGKVRSLLVAERLVLNVMQRMSGIATKTAYMQSLCKGTKARVCDTRKTTPGFRYFEKWAVKIGGGANHRFGLFDMILIKDNHIDFAGGIVEAVSAAQAYLRKLRKKIPIEVETRNIEDVRKVLAHGGVQRIMLDNYNVKDVRKAVQLINGSVEVEASGGINEKNIAAYAATGVDFISVGALTHQIKSLDLSLKAVS